MDTDEDDTAGPGESSGGLDPDAGGSDGGDGSGGALDVDPPLEP